MVTAVRQRKLFVAEDFRVIFRAFNEINFAAYDFDTIREAMVDYVRINFPEDFNDWIESSEFVALIELLAYLGQTLAFRMDLNTRENFIETAERRESILRLARLISFSPSRNFPATGLMKLTSISTNEPIIDSNGNNLSNQTVVWNDAINPDFFEQTILILNAVFSATNPFGTPFKAGIVGGIKTQLYTLNNDASANQTFGFSSNIDGESINFEFVNPDFTDGEIFFERDPDPEDPLHLIFRTDGSGNGSANTGFFTMFKQGILKNEDFLINIPIENRTINLEGTAINNIDVFVQEINEDGLIVEKWTEVPFVVGNNIIFNSLEKSERNIFETITRPSDQISIRFADGRFGNVPTGIIRVWFRESNGKRYQISPEDMRDIRLDIPYLDKVNNTIFFVSMTFSLQESVLNSSPSESSAQIRDRAPQIFATQNRMVNNEDYNIFPLRNSEAAKVKATNRIHSGFSRHIDINDPTGFSQSVNLFGEDGILYLEENRSLEELALPTTLTDSQIIGQIILPLVQSLERRHFFYFNYDRYLPSTSDPVVEIARATGSIGGTFIDTETIIIDGIPVILSSGPGTGVVAAVASIDAAGVAGIVVSNDNNRVQIEKLSASFTLAEGSGTSLATLGLTVGTFDPEPVNTVWRKATEAVNSSTGRLVVEFLSSIETAIVVGDTLPSTTTEFYIQEGSLLRFANAGLVSVVSIFDTGVTILVNGDGAIRLAEDVDDGDILTEILPPFRTLFNQIETNQILTQLAQKNIFGLRYDQDTLTWRIITGDNLASENEAFDFATAGDVTGLNVDTTWLVRAQFSPTNWRFISRGLDYIFESDIQIRFFHSEGEDIIDPQTGRKIRDFIKVLKVNTAFELITDFITPAEVDFQEIDPVESLNEDFIWNIEDVFVETDGFIDPRRVKVTFTDTDEDGVPDDPTFFEVITKITGSNITLELPDENPDETELFWEAFTNTDGFQEFRPSTVVVKAFNEEPFDFLITETPDSFEATFTLEPLTLVDGEVVFFRDTGNFFRVRIGVDEFEDVSAFYFMRRGRNNFFFQWKHFANPDRRIDPAITNIIDMYVLTASYDTLIRQWIDDNGTEIEKPSPPSTEQLRILFAEEVQNKMISDEIIFHPVLYKLLFGAQAPEELQARFKITKVVGTEVSDGEIKARVISAINEFFAINNWDFGETFYYTELAAFIHQRLATVISSVVIVPLDEESKFGNLFQVRSEPNEVFISTAKVSDIQIVAAFSADILRIGS